MNILFITSSRIGDAVLSTGLLDHIIRTERDAVITVVCGPLAASLFEGMPCQRRVIPLEKKDHNLHWAELWLNIVLEKWDIVVDLRDSMVSRLVLTGRRYVFSSHIDKKRHKVEQCADVMGLDFTPPPRLWSSLEQRRRAEVLVPDGGPVLAVGPAANWIGKTWPAERFVEVINSVTGAGGFMSGARVAVFAASGEEDTARKVLSALPAERQIDIIARADPGTAAAALRRCALYIGNDSGLMHCAAAVGIPTFGLFGPSYPAIYKPWGKLSGYVSTPETFDELIDFKGYDAKTLDRSLMLSLKTDVVIAALKKFWDEHNITARVPSLDR